MAVPWEAIAAAAGAALVAVLNEARAQLRARQADRDHARAKRDAVATDRIGSPPPEP